MARQTHKEAIKLGVLMLGRKRPGFDPEWGAAMAERVRACLARAEFTIFEPPDKIVDDESLRQAVAACEQSDVNVIVALQPTMADSRMAPTLHQLWQDPILLWATPENPTGDMISSCSLVGAHNWASILCHRGHAFDVVYGDPDVPGTLDDLSSAVRIAYTARRLRLARLGIVGGQAPGFYAMAVEPSALAARLGPQVQQFSLQQFADVVGSIGDEQISEDVAQVKALGIPHKDTTDDDLPTASRLYLAMRHFFEGEGCDALAIRCWPEMANMFGQWPYAGMARLAEEGRAIAMEGDGDGALGALIGECLGMGRCFLSDWLEHDDETITLWHGGNIPMSLSYPVGHERGPRFARHFNIRKPAVIESTLRADMPITICRLWHRGDAYLMTACEAVTLAPRRHLMGSNGLARLIDRSPKEWFIDLCNEGMPHHVAVFEGHHADLLKRFARVMRVERRP